MDKNTERLSSVGDVLRALVRSDTAIKLLFDHLRNIGICAVIFVAAAWKFCIPCHGGVPPMQKSRAEDESTDRSSLATPCAL